MELAEKIGVSRAAVAQWETQISQPDPEKQHDIAAALGIKRLTSLFVLVNKPHPKTLLSPPNENPQPIYGQETLGESEAHRGTNPEGPAIV
jgi:transcriptional regulator with XRE-family HTH domain